MLLNKATESSFVIAFTEKHVFMVIHSVMSSSSSVHGVFRERILEWFVISSSRGSSWPRDQTHISYISCMTENAGLAIMENSVEIP